MIEFTNENYKTTLQYCNLELSCFHDDVLLEEMVCEIVRICNLRLTGHWDIVRADRYVDMSFISLLYGIILQIISIAQKAYHFGFDDNAACSIPDSNICRYLA